jgi:hypothetical protein
MCPCQLLHSYSVPPNTLTGAAVDTHLKQKKCNNQERGVSPVTAHFAGKVNDKHDAMKA